MSKGFPHIYLIYFHSMESQPEQETDSLSSTLNEQPDNSRQVFFFFIIT